MSKYDPLRRHLADQPEHVARVRMTFSEAAKLVGPLPQSAWEYRPWWANGSLTQAQAWLNAGWKVDIVNLTAGHVTFVRSRPSHALGQSRPATFDGLERPPMPATSALRDPTPASAAPRGGGDSEADVQARLVSYLAKIGWQIQRVADTASRETGIDVLATKDDRTLAVEVKGYPGTRYADPRRANEVKPTNPSSQARQWYSHALLKALLTRDEHSEYEIAIGLPDATTYRSLYRRTAQSLKLLDIRVLFVSPDGKVFEDPGSENAGLIVPVRT
jgi:hypothetical protein